MNIWISSDTHFCHDREFLYAPRGFQNIETMNRIIIERWNSKVAPEDEVYHLGDVMLNDNAAGLECLSKLNGHIHIIRGNHDTDTRVEIYNRLDNVDCQEWHYSDMLKYGKYRFYLSHYPTITSNFDDGKFLRQRTINLCGHSHTNNPFADWEKYNAPIYHVEMDANNCYPCNIKDIIEIMQRRFNEEKMNASDRI